MNIKEFLTTKEAAQYMNVTPNTIRNWDKEKRIPVYHDPKTSFRIYKKEDLDKMNFPIGIEPKNSSMQKTAKKNNDNYKNILVRVPKEMLEALDALSNSLLGKPSRTSLIIDGIKELLALKKD